MNEDPIYLLKEILVLKKNREYLNAKLSEMVSLEYVEADYTLDMDGFGGVRSVKINAPIDRVVETLSAQVSEINASIAKIKGRLVSIIDNE